ncbi:hypothetical protein [Janthinobacterium sp.]|nr:hypothetical protein [Janthinobacterium sp.]
MASQQGTVDFFLDQLAGAGSINAKKMFGEYEGRPGLRFFSRKAN